jgi:phage/plasmid-associated DNA primase
MFSTNKIPQTKDDTTAYFRRWVIISCNNYFSPAKANTRILDCICTPNEFSGLLNWALIGLKRLLEHGQFSDNRTWEQERERYLASSNSALAYIENHVEPSLEEKDRITKEDLYAAYVTYCKVNDLPVMRQADLTTIMRQAVPDAREVQFRVGTERKKGWAHVTVTAVTASSLNTTVAFPSDVLSRNEVTEVTPGTREPLFASCYFCQKPIFEDDWKSDEFTAHKPAHKECYDHQQALLKKSEVEP